MPDPRLIVAAYLVLMVGCGVAIALAILWRAEARYWRRRAAGWRTRYNVMRRRAVAFRSGVPPPTGYKDGLPYWDAYELNRFAEKSG